MIKINNFSCGYNHNYLINNLNIEIKAGELVILCGKSGCGKSTLLNCIAGISPKIIKLNTTGDIICEDAAFVFQNPHIYSFANIVIEELSFQLENICIPPDKIFERVNQIAEIFGLQNLLYKNLQDLSAGQKMRVAIASALAASPKVLLFDEPLPALDNTCKKKFFEILKKLKENGHSIIISEHLIEPLLELTDKIIYIDDDNNLQLFNKPLSSEIIDFLFSNGIRTKKININNKKEYDPQTTVVELQNISFAYDNDKIIENMNYNFAKGNFIALTGDNGSGKTTLLKLISEIIKQDSGKIKITGKTAYIDQNPDRLLFEKTVFDEVCAGSSLNNNSIIEILKQLDILHLVNKNPLYISLGEKHRVAVAAAFASEPDIILLDEPATGLDYFHLKSFFDILHKYVTENNKTIITASNDLEIIGAYCDRIIKIGDRRQETELSNN